MTTKFEAALAAAMFFVFHGWLTTLPDLPDRLRIQGVVLLGVGVGAWLGCRRRTPLRRNLGRAACIGCIPIVIEFSAFAAVEGPLLVLGAPIVATAGTWLALGVVAAWRRFCGRSLIWSLAHAQLTVLAAVAATAILVLAVVQQGSSYLTQQTNGLSPSAQLAVRLVAGSMPVVVVVGGLCALALPLLLPPAALIAWLAAHGTARRVDGLLRTEAKAKARSELFARVAHELHSPICALRLVVDQIRVRAGHGCEVDVLDDGVRRLTRMAEDLRDLSRPDADGWQLQFTAVALAPAIESAVRAIAPLAQQLDVALVVDTAALRRITRRLDADRFAQVLTNLLHNALRHAGGGGIVQVHGALAGRHAHVVVRDTGSGVAPADLERIFAPGFSRAGGRGLGLAIVRELVESMGGSVQVQSVAGRGSTFTLVL